MSEHAWMHRLMLEQQARDRCDPAQAKADYRMAVERAATLQSAIGRLAITRDAHLALATQLAKDYGLTPAAKDATQNQR